MNKFIFVVAFLMIQSSAWAKLDRCSEKYSFSSPTSGKTIKCGSAFQCAKKHARASSYWQRVGNVKEKFIVSLKEIAETDGHHIIYSSITKLYHDGELIEKTPRFDSLFVLCKANR